MTVGIHLHENLMFQKPWRNFVAHVEKQSDTCDVVFEQMGTQLLTDYSAWTNWSDDIDPVWFAHEDGVTQFVLTWS